MSLAKNIAWRMKMMVLKSPGGYYWGYTKWVDVVLNQQARVAHQGGMADCLSGGPVAGSPRRYWTQALMADPKIGPWQVAL
jgi:hypothetical protein